MGRLLTSIFHVVFFQTVSGNKSVLAWYAGSTYIHVVHLFLLDKVHQILRHILKKCRKACMLLSYLLYIKSPFLKNLIRALQSNFSLVHKDTQMLKKAKTQRCCEPFYQKSLFITFSQFVNVIVVPLVFFYRPVPLNHSMTVYLEAWRYNTKQE